MPRSLAVLVVLLAATAGASSLDKQLIRKVMQTKSKDFQRCYEQALTRDGPSAAGKIVLKLDIESTGEVSAVAAESTFASWELKDCLESAARTLKFPKGAEKFRISYPLIFRQADAQPDAGAK